MSPKSVGLELKNSIKTMRASAKMSRDARVRSKKAKIAAAQAQKATAEAEAQLAAQDQIPKKPKKGVKKRNFSARATLKALFSSDAKRPKLTESDLINAESALGGTLFGKIPEGHRREFFRYKHNVWVFHESWTGQNGEKLEATITYEVRENGVYKLPLGGKYVKIEGAELDNFVKATKEYLKIIKQKLY